LGKAEARIRSAHCRTGRISRKTSSARKKNRVLAQSPHPGRKLARGARVGLVVGRGPR
jgi:beta-lactam-binding protein with PASTA domain